MSAQYTFWTPVDFMRLSMPARSMKLYISRQERTGNELSKRPWSEAVDPGQNMMTEAILSNI